MRLGWNKVREEMESLWEKKKITAHLPIWTSWGKGAALQNKAANVL